MKALAIIEQLESGKPKTNFAPSWVHLGPSPLTGNYKCYKVAASDTTLDALEAEAACVLLLKLSEGEPELDEENPYLLAVLNAFLSWNEMEMLPDGTTPRLALAAIDVDVSRFDVSDSEEQQE
ncbi:hypothetical protein Rctr71_100 [Virus Rctr71]|nr:hypothetical protein Rctr71_100 [Virus Rctr71]